MYYFVSDTHLGMLSECGDRTREIRFVQWLDSIAKDAEAIFLLGDIFDFWYEYRRVVPKGFTRLLGKFSELTDKGVEIHFFTGNHDMWVGDYLHTECGMQIHTSAEIVHLAGKTLFLAHGDNMYIKGQPMLRLMNWAFRSRGVRWAFSHLVYPDAAMRFGRWWSSSSRKSKSLKNPFRGEQEPLVMFARQILAREKDSAGGCPSCNCNGATSSDGHIDYFVFGHIHCAEDFQLSPDSRALFLGEWIHAPAYAEMDERGEMRLVRL